MVSWLSSVVRRYLFWFIPLIERSATGQCTALTSDLQEDVFDTAVTRLLQGSGAGLECERTIRIESRLANLYLSFSKTQQMEKVLSGGGKGSELVCVGGQAAGFGRGIASAIYGRGHFPC